MIRPVIPARKVSQGRRSDRGAFLQDVSIGDSSSVSKDTITARTVEKKKKCSFLFLFFFSRERQTVTIWRQWGKMTTGRREGLMRYSDSWAHLDLILQVIQHIVSSNQIHEENEEQIKKKKSWGRRKREKSLVGKDYGPNSGIPAAIHMKLIALMKRRPPPVLVFSFHPSFSPLLLFLRFCCFCPACV